MNNINFSKYDQDLLFVPLGGANEIGMNANLFYHQGKWLMVDLGIGFAGDWLPGVDIILPDLDFIMKRREDLIGLVITHAHEDHIGAVHYLWEDLKCPIYASPFAKQVLKNKCRDNNVPHVQIEDLTPNDPMNIGPFEVNLINLTHSIPEMYGLEINAGNNKILHTGDWKFDEKPMVGDVSDYEHLRKIGDEGVTALICDSTNAFVDGESGSESVVRENLIKLVANCSGRIAVSTFASNITRLESIVEAATAAGRKVALAGRSLDRMTTAAQDCGYLQGVEFLSDEEGASLPPDQVLFMCTGCQGEPLAALSKIADNRHPKIRFSEGDHVVFSSRVIPGNESKINHMINKFVRQGIVIHPEKEYGIHVSGHPAKDELKRMYELVRPKVAIPVHGEAQHIAEHARYAAELGIEHQIRPENGVVIRLSSDIDNLEEHKIIGNVHSGHLAVDGYSIIDSNSPIIKARAKLRDMGAVFISVIIDDDGNLLDEVAIFTPGFLDFKADKALILEIKDEIEAITNKLGKKRSGNRNIADAIKKHVRKMAKNELGKNPLIEVQVSSCDVG